MRLSMKHRTSLHTALFMLSMILVLSCVAAADAVAEENYAYIEVRRFHECSTTGDQILNLPQTFRSRTGVYYLNLPDQTHATIVNPNVTLITDATFSWINGNLPWGYWGVLEPNVTGPPHYMWFWENELLEGTEPADAIDIHCGEYESNVFAPGLSFEREVHSAVIRGPHAVQLTIARLRIEQPLPEYVNSISVGIATWQMTEHVATEYLTAVPTPSVVFRTQDIQWHIPADQLEVGKTYEFRALFKVYKRVDNPVIFKPNVGVGVSYRTPQPLIRGTSAAIQHADGFTAIVSADNIVSWAVTLTGGYGLSLSRISEMLPR